MAKSSKSRPASRTRKPAPLEGNEIWKSRSRIRKTGPTVREASAWEKLPQWSQHAICVGFLLLVAVGFFSATTFGGKTLAGGDTVQWRATAEAMLQAEAQTGRIPLWNPNVYAGMPGTMIYNPLRVPGVDSVLSGLREVGVWPVAHFFALLVGVYFLVVFLTRFKWPGVLAAVGYGLTAYVPIILVAGHNTKFVAMAYAPWLLLGFAALIRRDPDTGKMQSVFLTLLFAIAAAVQLRAGHVQITYYVVVAAGIWWIAEGISAVRTGRGVTFAVSTGLLLAGSALALAMVADPYLAQWEYKAFTTRSSGPSGGLTWDYAMAWSQGFGEMLTLLIPNAYGGGSQLYWGPKPFTVGPHYVGPVILLLAVLGLAGVARRSVVAFGVAALVMVGFSLGEHLPILNRPAFDLLPLFSSFRVPETWLAIVALLLALLAGWGAYYLQRIEATHEAEDRKRRTALIASGALGLVLVGLWLTGGGPLSFEKPGEQAQVEAAAAQQGGLPPGDPRVAQVASDYLRGVRADRAEAFRADAGRSVLFLVLAAGLIALLLWRKVPSYVALAGLALLATVDLWGVGRRYFNDDLDALKNRSDVAAAIPRTAADDYLLQRVAEAGGPGHFRVLPPNPLSNARPSYFYESIGGYNAARLEVFQTYFDRILTDAQGLNPNGLRLLSGRFLLVQGDVPGAVFKDPQSGFSVLEDSLALPRAFLVDSVAVVVDDDAAIARLQSPSFDPRTTALLTGDRPADLDASALTGPPPDSAGASVELQRFTPDEIVWTVRTDRDRLLVASELFYPAGWRAYLGATGSDFEVPIVRTDVVLRGVRVPEGEHLVTMRFEPESHERGVLISWIATLLAYGGAVALGGFLWYRRGHPVP